MADPRIEDRVDGRPAPQQAHDNRIPEQPSDRTTGSPAGNTTEQSPSDRAAGQSAGQPEGQVASRSGEQPSSDRADGQSAGGAGEQASGRSDGQVAGRSGEESSSERAGGQSAGGAGEQASGRSDGQVAGRSAEQSSSERAGGQSAGRSAEQASGRSEGQVAGRSGEQSSSDRASAQSGGWTAGGRVIEEPAGFDQTPTDRIPVASDFQSGRAAGRSGGTTSKSASAVFADDVTSRLRDRWRALQADFVDDPTRAVQGADELVDDVLRELAERKRGIEGSWRGSGDTEELRVAMRAYRSFFDQLLNM